MHSETVEHLLNVNREFYQSFAEPFAESRSRPQPGVADYLKLVGPDARVLDLGCGSGSLANALYRRGHRGPYTGVDASPGLLAWARQHADHKHADFKRIDLAQPGWSASLGPPYDWVFALAVIHHMPGSEQRSAWAAELGDVLAADGRALISVWNFVGEPRYADRIRPWSEIGLSDDEVEHGDYLLDWRRGGHGLRYVHWFEPEELSELAAAAECRPTSTTTAGGASGRLNLIQLWEPLTAAGEANSTPNQGGGAVL